MFTSTPVNLDVVREIFGSAPDATSFSNIYQDYISSTLEGMPELLALFRKHAPPYALELMTLSLYIEEALRNDQDMYLAECLIIIYNEYLTRARANMRFKSLENPSGARPVVSMSANTDRRIKGFKGGPTIFDEEQEVASFNRGDKRLADCF